MYETPLLMVEDEEALEAACAQLRGEPVIGVDTEADSMYHYREKVCLIQVTDSRQDYIIDPLAIGHIGGLRDIFSDASVVKIFHGADYDVISLKRDFDLEVKNLFDTMIAAQIVGLPKVGLADLCANYFGAAMNKKYQRHNWAARPLLPEHLTYARGDSHYLLALREKLMALLSETRREDVAQEEFRLLEAREWQEKAFDPEGWWRIKQARTLDDKGRRILRKLYVYRNAQAKAMDRPPYKVMPDQFLMQVAHRRPKSLGELKKLARPRSQMLRRHGESLVKEVHAGLGDRSALSDSPARKGKEGVRPPFGGRDTERLFQRLKDWRSQRAGEQDLPVSMLASNAQLKQLAGWRPHTLEDFEQIEDIRHWQVSRYGEVWLSLIREFEKEHPPRDKTTPPRSNRRRRRRNRSRRKTE